MKQSMYLLLFVFFAAAFFANCTEEDAEKLQSDVQAVATLLELSDGIVESELILISTGSTTHNFIIDAENVQVRVPGGAKVTLTQKSDGHYFASSKDSAELIYTGGEAYQFSFELTQETDAGSESEKYVAVTTAPDDAVAFTVDKTHEFAGDTAKISWTPKTFNAIISVYDPDSQITYSTFDFSEPQFEGDKWARLGSGGSITLSVDTFPTAGAYTVKMCAVTKNAGFDKELSSNLGVLSGFLAGKCAPDASFNVAE